MIRVGVLASGSGSNLQAILDAVRDGRIEGSVAAVVCNVPGARALERAQVAGVPAELLPSKGVADREAYDREVVKRLRDRGVDLVCLAGWMRIVTPAFLEAFAPSAATRGCPRVMNVHPALLPSFPGLHAQRQALEYGVRLTGCTVHFVDAGTDTGPVIVQAVVPVLPGDDEAALSARILVEEHRIYPLAVQWFAEGRLEVSGRTVRVRDAAAPLLDGVSNPSRDR
ncbi:MAG TPA: phosphoribosylglycinamide formyltransferase [Anaeromyxobacteraceae bacterium]|nr:phosphoribosylglycinamide formyltransferase [Anaeromyxobacteraceae bacterium]